MPGIPRRESMVLPYSLLSMICSRGRYGPYNGEAWCAVTRLPVSELAALTPRLLLVTQPVSATVLTSW